ncbi:MAG: L-threonylcarbamoyladenylate synthase [Candidatus Paceibacterota bacterium]
MRVIHLDGTNLIDAASEAAAVVRKGGVVLYPTDTLYGLGADAFSDDAVAKVFRIKGRNEGKPMHAIVDGLGMAERYGDISEDTKKLAAAVPRGQLTFIVRKRADVVNGISKDISTFGFRIPDNDFCIQMLRAFGKPITATSANRAGETPLRSVDAILEQLGLPAQVGDAANGIDLIIDAGELPVRKASSVVDLSGPEPKMLREGAVLASQVMEILRR